MGDSEDKKHVNSLEKSKKGSDNEATYRLKSEIELLDQELRELQQNLRPYENLIYEQLRNEFSQLAMLSELHKKYTKEKKQKRQEQKERGKNYKAAKNIIKASPTDRDISSKKDLIKADLKKIYREAIIQIHPDKISHNSESDKIEAATDLTSQLNELYKNGDLDQLKLFYYSLSQGHALPVNTDEDKEVNHAQEYRNLLLKAQSELELAIESLKASSYFQYYTAGKTPQEFSDDLRLTLLLKIKKLERRTRKAN